jgi:hypothetical protein
VCGGLVSTVTQWRASVMATRPKRGMPPGDDYETLPPNKKHLAAWKPAPQRELGTSLHTHPLTLAASPEQWMLSVSGQQGGASRA